MTRWTIMLACLSIGVSAAPAAEPLPLRVLYVGTNKGPRSQHFEKILKQQFHQARVVERQAFKPTDVRDAEVVRFDWSQSEGSLNTAQIPLGKPEQWSEPTVLLNHAGLLVAAHWQLIGYRWMIDPLTKKRAIPTAKLQGPARATLPGVESRSTRGLSHDAPTDSRR